MTTSPEDSILLQNAQNKIAYLTDDIRRLSAELRKKKVILSSFSEKLREKELLLSSFTDLATDQSKQISTLSAALQDTVLWDPSGIRAPVSSTPGPPPWTEVTVPDRRRRHTRAVIPALPLGNRYEALAAVEGSITPPAKSDEQQDLPRASPAQSSPPATSHRTLASVPAIGAAPPVDSSLGAEVISNGCPRVPPVKHPSVAASTIQSDQPGKQQNGYSSSRRRLVQEAVSRRSAPFPTVPPEAEPDSASPLQPSVEQPLQGASGTTATTHGTPGPKIPVIQSLFPPSTLIIGDSITRHLRYFNVITRCMPGALVTDVLAELRDMLPTLPSTIRRIIIHVGSNDSARCQSELTKTDFSALISYLKQCGKSVFFSGPIPTIGRRNERFSRLLSLNTWLRDTCGETNVGFIDNFDVFWNRQSLYLRDGLHPNAKGSRLLAANIHYAVTCIDTRSCSRRAQK